MTTSSFELATRELAYFASLGALAAQPSPAPLSLARRLAAKIERPAVVAKKPRSTRFVKSDVITVITRQHKMKEGAVNLRRFMAIEDGSTVEEAHDLGIDNGYLAYYVRNGLIAIGG